MSLNLLEICWKWWRSHHCWPSLGLGQLWLDQWYNLC